MTAASHHIAVVTGSRAEFGLLRSTIDAIQSRDDLTLSLVAAGSHFLSPAHTIDEVESVYPVAARVPMQVDGSTGRAADAKALGRGVSGFADVFASLNPDWVLVLGDRIEAFAAASAGSIGGWSVAHIHGGDLAEGVADDAMRHAITKLSHLHLPASAQSAQRIAAMGEPHWRIIEVGSPALDDIDDIAQLSDTQYAELGSPNALLALHPTDFDDATEHARALDAYNALIASGLRPLVLAPNADPGSAAIRRAYASQNIPLTEHLPRSAFLGLFQRVHVAVGNSSALIIEASGLRAHDGTRGVPVVDLGDRQRGRERCAGVIHTSGANQAEIEHAIQTAQTDPARSDYGKTPYGSGHAGAAITQALCPSSGYDPIAPRIRRKLNSA